MSLKTKAIRGSGLTQLRSSVSTSEGTTQTTVEKWTGPYDQLKIKQTAVLASAKSTQLDPSEAGHGVLSITYEIELSSTPAVPGTITLEVVWQELRKPIETHPYFKDISDSAIADVKKKAGELNATPPTDAVALKLYQYLLHGVTEWSTGVPVVRRTTTKRAGSLAGGRAWFRDTPPVAVGGSWQFLKTADELRREGKSFTQTEEWTGAERWDTLLYP